MAVKEFYTDKDGIALHCKLEMPEGIEGRPHLVILQHGLTGHMEERHITAVKDAMLRGGCAVLRTELYGHGKSGGTFENHTVWEWVSEMLYMIRWARRTGDFCDISLSGHSQGGLTVLLAGGMAADEIKALLLLSPAVNIRDNCRESTLLGESYDIDSGIDTLRIGENRFSSDYVRTAAVLPVEECVSRFKGRVMVVHGTEDEAVPYEYAVKTAAMYKDASLITIPGDTHCYDLHLEAAVRAAEEFAALIRKDDRA